MNYINQPHLPRGQVRHIIVGEKYKKQLEKPLFDNNLCPIWLPDNPYVDKRLSGHCDLSALHIGKNRLIMSEYLIDEKFTNLELDASYIADSASSAYPDDAGLNLCILGNKIICSKKTASTAALNKMSGYEVISVKQGYTKCSVCIVNETALITDDDGIYNAAQKTGIDALKVEKGFIKLDGFEHGFIGGASFKISSDKLAFTGFIYDNAARLDIEEFLQKYDTTAIYLTDEPAFDIGSAIPLTECL